MHTQRSCTGNSVRKSSQADSIGNQLCNVVFNFTNDGSVQRSMLTFSAIRWKSDDDRCFRINRKAYSIASLGREGFICPSDNNLLARKVSRNDGVFPSQPNTESTWGESLHTHISSSGSITTAFARSCHPLPARWFSTSVSKSSRDAPSLPLPS